MKKFVVILLFYSFVFFVHGMKLAEFEDIYKPRQIEVSGNDLYVVDGESIKLFSIKDLKLIKIIGSKGEGPGEFKMVQMFQLFPDHIFVSDYGKIHYFKRSGEFIREKIISTDISLDKIRENYISARHDYKMEKGVIVSTFSILDKDFNELKNLYSTSREFTISPAGNKKRDMKLFKKVKRSFTDGEYIYVMDTHKGFYFDILDHTGTLLITVNRKGEKVRVSEKFKKEYKEYLKKLGNWKKWGSKYNYIFPEYFPAISYLSGDQNKIYLFSKVNHIKKSQLSIYDHKGMLLKEALIPRGDISTIYNNKLYYMVENADDEVWELHSVDL